MQVKVPTGAVGGSNMCSRGSELVQLGVPMAIAGASIGNFQQRTFLIILFVEFSIIFYYSKDTYAFIIKVKYKNH